MERIAKGFEKKYVSSLTLNHISSLIKKKKLLQGNSSSYGKKPTKQKECDKGAGYDESDSFIDNAEAVSSFSIYFPKTPNLI